MIDDVIKDQLSQNIIEPIPDLTKFVEQNENISFLAHMPVIKPSSNTTKVRLVFLANLASRGEENNLSHNQVLARGMQLNRTISTALMLQRFNKNMLIYDIKKAFLQLKLKHEDDKNRLAFLWFKSVESKDFSLCCYRPTRVQFGLRTSPSLLMTSLFHMLVHSVKEDDEDKVLKKELYEYLYMDNGSVNKNDSLVDVFW